MGVLVGKIKKDCVTVGVLLRGTVAVRVWVCVGVEVSV